MEIIMFKRTAQLLKERAMLEKRLKIKITIEGKKVVIEGEPINEYEASMVLNAFSLGFPLKTSLLLKEEEMKFEVINIKDLTRRKNLHEVRARVIGTYGKTKSTLEGLTGCKIIVKDNDIGIIGSTEAVERLKTALTSLVKGSKQSNMYSYLEKLNRIKKEEELGLKY